MMNKIILTSILTLLGISASAVTLRVAPGELAEKLPEAVTDGELIVDGAIDARDLSAIRKEGAKISTLDLSKTSIAELHNQSAVHLGKSNFQAGHLPSYILFQAPARTILLPQELSVIEPGALAGSEIETIVVPEGVTTIGEYAFYGCPNLKAVTLPSTLLSIGRGAFANCQQLVAINLEETRVTSLPEDCLAGDYSLRSLVTPGIRTIESRALAGTGIESLDLPEVQTLAPYALADMNYMVFLSVNPNARFDKGALMNCHSLMTLQGVPENIPDLFAANCYNLEPGVVLGDARTIGKYSVANSRASTVVFGQELTLIDENAFKGAVGLNHIDATNLEDVIPEVAENSFAGIEPSAVRVKVNADKEEEWKNHPVWGQFDIYSDNATTEVDKIEESNEGIRVRLMGHILQIDAPQPITSGSIYDTSGNRLLDIPSGGTSVSLDISDLPKGVSIVSVKTTDDFKGIKILL